MHLVGDITEVIAISIHALTRSAISIFVVRPVSMLISMHALTRSAIREYNNQ
ncbi:hypothetical protein JCM19046_3607 [Bacillus sp. JCM 19046]|nr:hypothetical protein JCM19045_3500 [Bacillus sp. JCM 19045]GAF18989.1 hypothetical protein JCM19046_3607 [Bacillus sp. JCM 19046]